MKHLALAIWHLIVYLAHIHKWRYSDQRMQRYCPNCGERQYRVWCDGGGKSKWYDSLKY